jgi:hypothetical protein
MPLDLREFWLEWNKVVDGLSYSGLVVRQKDAEKLCEALEKVFLVRNGRPGSWSEISDAQSAAWADAARETAPALNELIYVHQPVGICRAWMRWLLEASSESCTQSFRRVQAVLKSLGSVSLTWLSAGDELLRALDGFRGRFASAHATLKLHIDDFTLHSPPAIPDRSPDSAVRVSGAGFPGANCIYRPRQNGTAGTFYVSDDSLYIICVDVNSLGGRDWLLSCEDGIRLYACRGLPMGSPSGVPLLGWASLDAQYLPPPMVHGIIEHAPESAVASPRTPHGEKEQEEPSPAGCWPSAEWRLGEGVKTLHRGGRAPSPTLIRVDSSNMYSGVFIESGPEEPRTEESDDVPFMKEQWSIGDGLASAAPSLALESARAELTRVEGEWAGQMDARSVRVERDYQEASHFSALVETESPEATVERLLVDCEGCFQEDGEVSGEGVIQPKPCTTLEDMVHDRFMHITTVLDSDKQAVGEKGSGDGDSLPFQAENDDLAESKLELPQDKMCTTLPRSPARTVHWKWAYLLPSLGDDADGESIPLDIEVLAAEIPPAVGSTALGAGLDYVVRVIYQRHADDPSSDEASLGSAYGTGSSELQELRRFASLLSETSRSALTVRIPLTCICAFHASLMSSAAGLPIELPPLPDPFEMGALEERACLQEDAAAMRQEAAGRVRQYTKSIVALVESLPNNPLRAAICRALDVCLSSCHDSRANGFTIIRMFPSEGKGASPMSDADLLAQQEGRCQGCGAAISKGAKLLRRKNTYRRCEQSGRLFCKGMCHEGEKRIIPAKVVRDLDFTPYPVCTIAAKYLDDLWTLPVLFLEETDGSAVCARMEHDGIFRLRRQLTSLRSNLEGADLAGADSRLVYILGHSMHLCMCADIFSLADLQDMLDGELELKLVQAIDALKWNSDSKVVMRYHDSDLASLL